MRSFLVTACCVIVGLQVLIGVPLAVCVVFLSLVEAPAPVVLPGPVAYDPAPVCLPTCPPPVEWPAKPAVTDLQPIVESRAIAGSPLAESSLAASSPAEDLRQFVTALEQVATGEAILPPAEAPAKEPADCGNPPLKPEASCQSPLVDSLSTSVEQLYAHAQRLETDGNYGRADQVRRLAREIRDVILQNQSRSPSERIAEPAPAPTVTEASFNPEPPPPPAPAVPPPPVPVEPSPAALTPPPLPPSPQQ
jgi:hypothetical protein